MGYEISMFITVTPSSYVIFIYLDVCQNKTDKHVLILFSYIFSNLHVDQMIIFGKRCNL